MTANVAAESVDGDPVLAAITSDVRREWTGTTAELLTLIDGRWSGTPEHGHGNGPATPGH